MLDIDLGGGSFGEVAFFHKRSHTLLLTDSILSIPEEPLAITQLDPYPLLFHARDHAREAIADHPENRRKGWQRISLFAVYFRPHAVEMTELGQMFRDAFQAPQHSPKAYFGLYPFRWRENWQQSFDILRSNGRPFVAPILQILIFPQAPKQVILWADQVASWDFRQIIACHFDSPIQTSPDEFRQAFNFLEKQPALSEDLSGNRNQPLLEEDMQFIRELEAGLVKQGIAKPPKI